MLQVVGPQSSSRQRGWPGSRILWAVGTALDQQLTCNVFEGGFVWPAAKLLPRDLAGMLEGVKPNGAEQERGTAGPARSEAGSWSGATTSDSTEGTAAPAADASLVGTVEPARNFPELSHLPEWVQADLVEALRAYPQFGVRGASTAAWFTGVVQPIADLPVTATIATFYPLDVEMPVTSWAWWQDGVWIGPRHTYSNGSICSYEPEDGTWDRTRRLRLLTDLNVTWVVRQLYLRAYGRWPGRQRIHQPWERLTQQEPGELCGCGALRLYADCCFESDRRAVPAERVLVLQQSHHAYTRLVRFAQEPLRDSHR